MKKIDFNTALSALMELAISQGNSLTDKQIKETFDGILEDDSLYSHIYEYLKQRNVTVTDKDIAEPKVQPVTSDKPKTELTEEDVFYNMYIKDISKIRSKNEKQIATLLEKCMSGDKDARNSLVEHHLKLVVTISEQFEGKGVRTSDLIQEGNLALIYSIDSYNGQDNFSRYLISNISHAMQNAIDEENGSAQIANHLVERVNALSDATTDLVEKLGREATIEEICEYMSLPEDEIRAAMKISLDALTIEENNIN
ncbi:MAG: sigma-70 family RNA polymerase sigma factor [Lachnospiraceae bacterium]|nr:sigma-70 family RNA polymerase sigma factor [Lachnospiraceae bacterium]